MRMEIHVGYDFEAFKQYYEALWGKLGETEKYYVKQDPSHLIVMTEENTIIGDIIWHKSSTREHIPGNPRDVEDTEIILKLLGKHCEFVELHELWLMKEHRGKGYGKKLLDFFEAFMRTQGFKTVIYYAYHTAAIAICRTRGYDEACCREMQGIEGSHEKMHVFCISL